MSYIKYQFLLLHHSDQPLWLSLECVICTSGPTRKEAVMDLGSKKTSLTAVKEFGTNEDLKARLTFFMVFEQ